jgi:hypothetical protein
MSLNYHVIPAAELFRIATDASNVKIQTLVKEYYTKIIAAAHEGKFNVSIQLENFDFGTLTREEMSALETINTLFPGIQMTTNTRFPTMTFTWCESMIED